MVFRKVKRMLKLDNHAKLTEARITERELEVTYTMATKLHQEGEKRLRAARTLKDKDMEKEAREMINIAQSMRGGEATLLSAMGVLGREST